MNTSSSKSPDSGAWRDLYKAALFEVDNARLPERSGQAEKALALRARELFYIAGDNIEEEQALDDTMYALHALRSTSQTRSPLLSFPCGCAFSPLICVFDFGPERA
jgi:hypothetical protein